MTLKLFADDAKLYADIRVVHTCDADELQMALDELTYWADVWHLSLSIQRCCVLNIGDPTAACILRISDCILPTVFFLSRPWCYNM